MLDNLKAKLLNSPEWVLSICVFLVYWLVNKSYTGPTVLDDEIGYLANAALISGHIIDGASQYHAGYSFFLAPFFLIFSEPSSIWQAAMVLNVFIWAVSFLLLARILKIIRPEHSRWQLLMALLVAAVYPTWITISGYVFATTAFVFVYLLSILALLYWKPDKLWTIIPHCLFVGYLYWIHPVGLAVAVASFLVVGFVSIREKRYASVILTVVLLAGLITFYSGVIDKWLIAIATPEGYSPLSDYPDTETIIGRMASYEFWLHLFAKSAGQISYLIISSFGLIFLGFIASINKSYQMITGLNRDNGSNSIFNNESIHAFLVLSLLGVLAMGAFSFSGTESRIDHWIYGRFSEMVVLPLLAIGLLSSWHKKKLLFAALFVFTTGLILNQVADVTASSFPANTIAFWPRYVILDANYLHWMTLGSLVLVLVGIIKMHSKLTNILIIACIVMVFIFSAAGHSYLHHKRISYYGEPSAFVEIIRENHPLGTCIGFNPKDFNTMLELEGYKYHLYLFHLYDYDYRRMSPEAWLKNCNGPYFTYHLDGLYEQEGVRLIGKEVSSNLYLLMKDDRSDITTSSISKPVMDIYLASGWSVDYILDYQGDQLAEMAGPAGNYEEGSIYSTGEDGFLLLDSTKNLSSGKYNFVLRGEGTVTDGLWADIVSDRSEIVDAKFVADNSPEANNGVITAGKFLLEEAGLNLKVRVHVDSSDIVCIDGYEIEYISEFEESVAEHKVECKY